MRRSRAGKALAAAALAAILLSSGAEPSLGKSPRKKREPKPAPADFDVKLPVLGTRLAEFPPGPGKAVADLATLQAVITHRYAVVTSYARTLKTAYAAELAHLRARAAADYSVDLPSIKRMKRWLLADPATLSEGDRVKLTSALAKSKALATIYAMRQDLASLWERSTESSEQLLARLQDWCHRAEASGIPPLAQFSLQLKRYA